MSLFSPHDTSKKAWDVSGSSPTPSTIAGTNQRAQNGSINNANWPGSAGRTVVANDATVTATADAPFGNTNPFVTTPAPSNPAPYYDPRFKNAYSQQ